MPLGDTIKGLFKEGLFQALFEGLKWLFFAGLPLVGGALPLLAGYLQGYPALAWLIMASAVTFAALAVGLLRFQEWQDRQSAADKVGFAGAGFAIEYIRAAETGDVTGSERSEREPRGLRAPEMQRACK